MKFLALDCETGGIGLDKSLLTTYLAVYTFIDDVLTLEDDLYLYTKPKDGIYNCTGEALGINQIDLVEHDKIATTYPKAGGQLREFLQRHSDDGSYKLIPVGHNVKFDLIFIQDKLLKSLYHFVSYRTLDTGSIGQFLKLCKLIPDDNYGSLSALADHLGAMPEGELHDAKTDTVLTVDVLLRCVGMIKNLSSHSSND